MTTQKEVFLESEADQWFDRNFKEKSKQGIDEDIALQMLIRMNKKYDSVLEVGCADGWRLAQLQNLHGSQCSGIDPSDKAIAAGLERFPGINLKVGTAELLDYPDETYDLIILGFCLCLCDRKDLFSIAQETDRVLKPGGSILVTDFLPPIAYRNKWHHVAGVNCYKMDYSSMFLWNPQYLLHERSVVDYHSGEINAHGYDDQISTSLLIKCNESVYPLSPYENEHS